MKAKKKAKSTGRSQHENVGSHDIGMVPEDMARTPTKKKPKGKQGRS